MPMSSGGHAASSSGCATRPKVRESGSHGYAVPTQHSLPIGGYVMATAEHREPCDSRGSCTVLGAPGGEIPPGDSTWTSVPPARDVRFTLPVIVCCATSLLPENILQVEGQTCCSSPSTPPATGMPRPHVP